MLGVDPKAKQRISFTGNLARNPVANTTMIFIIEETKIYWFYVDMVKVC